MAEPKDVAEVVAIISAAYPSFAPTEHTVEVYYQFLRDIPASLLKQAAAQSVAEAGRKFAPSIGELRGAVAEIRRVIAGTPSSYDAWHEVLKAILEVGSYGTPVFSHPLVTKAVRALGWHNLCMSENQAADRARFIEAYEQFDESTEVEAMRLPEVDAYIRGDPKFLEMSEQIHLLARKLEDHRR